MNFTRTNDATNRLRHDWSRLEVEDIYNLPFPDLMFQAQSLHRAHFQTDEIETARLLNIKTGGCPEDCGYCSQSAHYETGVEAGRLMKSDDVLDAARQAKEAGASRFCMAAAWRNPKQRDLDRVCDMVRGVKQLGLSTCATLGMLTAEQARQLKAAGLDLYNHNIDTSAEFYDKIITTRTIQDRLDTLGHARQAGLKLCCGGIVGLGESVDDRLGMLLILAGLDPHPESVPVNMWSEVDGVPVARTHEPPDPIAFVRIVATARILMPRSVVRLSAGRHAMSDEWQALCFLAGANSIFIGDKLLTTPNPGRDRDGALMERLAMRTTGVPASATAEA
jgi:biotin synthase